MGAILKANRRTIAPINITKKISKGILVVAFCRRIENPSFIGLFYR